MDFGVAVGRAVGMGVCVAVGRAGVELTGFVDEASEQEAISRTHNKVLTHKKNLGFNEFPSRLSGVVSCDYTSATSTAHAQILLTFPSTRSTLTPCWLAFYLAL